MHFGKIDKTDFLIPPFALFYLYTVFAVAFDLPLVSTQEFFHSEGIVVGRRIPFLCGLDIVATQPSFIWQEFSCGN